MSGRSFEEELERARQEVERDNAMLEQVWAVMRGRSDEVFEVAASDIVELQEACSDKPAQPAPRIVNAVRC